MLYIYSLYHLILSCFIKLEHFLSSSGLVSPFQALQFVERKVEDVSHVVIGAPGGRHLILQGEDH